MPVTFTPKPGFESAQGTIIVNNFRSYNVGAGLLSGGGQIIVPDDDFALINALDRYQPLRRTVTVASPPEWTLKAYQPVWALVDPVDPGVDEVVRRRDGRLELTASTSGSVVGLPVLDNLQPVATIVPPNNFTSGAGVTASLVAISSRFPISPVDDCSLIRFAFGNWYVNVSGTDILEAFDNPVTISVGLEVVKNGNTATVGLISRKTLSVGESVLTPPIDPQYVKGSDSLFLRTYAEVSANTLKIPFGQIPDGGSSAFYNAAGLAAAGAAADQTTGTGALSLTNASGPSAPYGGPIPYAIVGRLETKRKAIVGALHDSIGAGYYDPDLNTPSQGWIRRACEAAGYPVVRLGRANERMVDVNPAAGVSALRNARRRALLEGCTHVVVQLGVNDPALSSRTLVQMQADDTAICSSLQARGITVIRATVTPNTSMSAGNKTTRNDFNDWIRAGQSHHDYVLEVADVVETARNSSVFVTGYNQDQVHLNTTGHQAVVTAIQAQLSAILPSVT